MTIVPAPYRVVLERLVGEVKVARRLLDIPVRPQTREIALALAKLELLVDAELEECRKEVGPP